MIEACMAWRGEKGRRSGEDGRKDRLLCSVSVTWEHVNTFSSDCPGLGSLYLESQIGSVGVPGRALSGELDSWWSPGCYWLGGSLCRLCW